MAVSTKRSRTSPPKGRVTTCRLTERERLEVEALSALTNTCISEVLRNAVVPRIREQLQAEVGEGRG